MTFLEFYRERLNKIDNRGNARPFSKQLLCEILKVNIKTLNKLLNLEITPRLDLAMRINSFTGNLVTYEDMLAVDTQALIKHFGKKAYEQKLKEEYNIFDKTKEETDEWDF